MHRLMGGVLVMLSVWLVTATERRRVSDRLRCLEQLSAAFRQLARDLNATAPPLRVMLERLPRERWTTWLLEDRTVPPGILDREERQAVLEAASVLGGYEAGVQAELLQRTAEYLDRRKARLEEQWPGRLRMRQAVTLCWAAAAVILLL